MEMLLAVTEATVLARMIGAPSIYSARLGEASPAEPGVRTEASAYSEASTRGNASREPTPESRARASEIQPAIP